MWLQEIVGNVGLSSDSTEEDLRLCLRNGIVLCKLINKVQPGAVHKVRTPTHIYISFLCCRIIFNTSRIFANQAIGTHLKALKTAVGSVFRQVIVTSIEDVIITS